MSVEPIYSQDWSGCCQMKFRHILIWHNQCVGFVQRIQTFQCVRVGKKNENVGFVKFLHLCDCFQLLFCKSIVYFFRLVYPSCNKSYYKWILFHCLKDTVFLFRCRLLVDEISVCVICDSNAVKFLSSIHKIPIVWSFGRFKGSILLSFFSKVMLRLAISLFNLVTSLFSSFIVGCLVFVFWGARILMSYFQFKTFLHFSFIKEDIYQKIFHLHMMRWKMYWNILVSIMRVLIGANHFVI